jgi:excisionase family DNA binding protein
MARRGFYLFKQVEPTMPPLQKPLPINERAAFTVGDACLYSGTSKTQLYRFMDDGRVKFIKLGNRRHVLRESLDKLLTPTP